MPNSFYLLDGEVTENTWQTLAEDFSGELPEGNVLLPINYWLENGKPTGDNIGVWLNGDSETDLLEDASKSLKLIAIKFPTFMDGRGFSLATLLRERLGFEGELRAIGHVIRDQLFYLKRCGFNGIEFNEGLDLEAAKQSLIDFSETYQGAADNKQPIYRRHQL